ncbi:MAG: hypothetical protein NTX64_10110 [Elusimicrobia bacterium]|nr:hypothetical protein [Elusimicrobiota bacterium]
MIVFQAFALAARAAVRAYEGASVAVALGDLVADPPWDVATATNGRPPRGAPRLATFRRIELLQEQGQGVSQHVLQPAQRILMPKELLRPQDHSVHVFAARERMLSAQLDRSGSGRELHGQRGREHVQRLGNRGIGGRRARSWRFGLNGDHPDAISRRSLRRKRRDEGLDLPRRLAYRFMNQPPAVLAGQLRRKQGDGGQCQLAGLDHGKQEGEAAASLCRLAALPRSGLAISEPLQAKEEDGGIAACLCQLSRSQLRQPREQTRQLDPLGRGHLVELMKELLVAELLALVQQNVAAVHGTLTTQYE